MKVLRREDIKALRDKIPGNDPVLGTSSKNWVLDHDHVSGFCRGIIDRDTNQFIGKIESAYARFLKGKTDKSLVDILADIRIYLTCNPQIFCRVNFGDMLMHPDSAVQTIRRFARSSSTHQINKLAFLGYSKDDLESLTKAQRTAIFKNYLLDKSKILKV